MKRTVKLLFLIYLYSFTATLTFAQNPESSMAWKQYSNVEEVGFSEEALNRVMTQVDSLDTAALLVIYKGNILLSYGETTRKFMLHSVRKSLLNAMIGIEVGKGTINLNQSLANLNIDDKGHLTDAEKKATIRDLLSARSGIYLPAAYAPQWMINDLPERGSHKPGTYWFYNNWDFNALLTIYEQQSHKHFFEAFKAEIAGPIGMEDFDLEDTFYRYETDKSVHPAYLFRMSARDMARFGLLYLNHGMWNGNQLVPPSWIEKSTQPVSTDLDGFSSRNAYGFLWWIKTMHGRAMYYASGADGQRIMVFPKDDLVIVHLTNTYENFSVSDGAVDRLAIQILNAKHNAKSIASVPKLTQYHPVKTVLNDTYKGSMDIYIGTYTHRFLGEISIKKQADGYVLETNVGTFRLYVTSENSFIPEDIEIPLIMAKTKDENKRFVIEPVMESRKSIKEMRFYY